MLTAAVVGCGPRGREHAEALRAIDGIALVGVVDVNPARRTAVGEEFRVPMFATLAELLRHHLPHVVVLAIPASARLPLVELVVQCRGVRALVVEKPMAHRLTEAHRIVGLCEDAGVHLVVGHQLRFCPEFVALRDAVDRGELGRLSSFAGWCYGNLLDQGPHILDLVCWLAGDRRPLWVMSQQCRDPDIVRRFTAGSVSRRDDPAHPAPPWMVHHLAFEDGLRATIETGPLHQRSGVFVDDWLQKRMRVVGSEGLAEAQAAGYFRILRDGVARREQAGTLAGYQTATRRFHEELRDVVLRGGRHRNDARGALRSLELVVACAQSAVDGGIAAWPLDHARDPIAELGERRGPEYRLERSPGPDAPDVAPHSASRPEFSLLITLPDHYGHAVESVRSWTQDQRYPRERYEVIIIGNGSEPAVESAVRALLGPQDRFITVPTDNDLEMYHRGTEVARGHWLLFTEPHCIGEPECLAELADYLGRTTLAGACLRSVGGNREAMARLEDRMFQEGFAECSRPGDWRKVILRGFALRRDIYREVGGFEYQFERFSEWALAATLHARGFVVGYAPGAGVTHFNPTSFAQLFPGVANFTRGECAYRASKPSEYCERYFGSPPEWLDRHRLRRDVGRHLAGAAWRSSWRDGWGHGVRGVLFVLAMLREMAAALPSALFGPRAHVLGARLGLLVARLRLGWLSVGDEARYRAYRRFWDAMVRFARLDYLAGHEGRGPESEVEAVQFNVAELPDDRLTGFHGRETWRGRSFRWVGAAGMIRLDAPSGSYEVCLDTGGVVGAVAKRPVGIFWNGHKVPRAGLRCHDGRLSFSVLPEWVVPGRQQTLTLTCAPVLRRNPQERRRLGLPIFDVTFVPRDELTRRAGGG